MNSTVCNISRSKTATINKPPGQVTTYFQYSIPFLEKQEKYTDVSLDKHFITIAKQVFLRYLIFFKFTFCGELKYEFK